MFSWNWTFKSLPALDAGTQCIIYTTHEISNIKTEYKKIEYVEKTEVVSFSIAVAVNYLALLSTFLLNVFTVKTILPQERYFIGEVCVTQLPCWMNAIMFDVNLNFESDSAAIIPLEHRFKYILIQLEIKTAHRAQETRLHILLGILSLTMMRVIL